MKYYYWYLLPAGLFVIAIVIVAIVISGASHNTDFPDTSEISGTYIEENAGTKKDPSDEYSTSFPSEDTNVITVTDTTNDGTTPAEDTDVTSDTSDVTNGESTTEGDVETDKATEKETNAQTKPSETEKPDDTLPPDISETMPDDETEYTEPSPSEDDPYDTANKGTPYISDRIVIYGTRGMEQFGGKEGGGQACAEALNEFKRRIGSGVNVYAMAIPTAAGIYAPKTGDFSSSLSCTERAFNGLKGALDGVIYIDTLSILRAHSDEYLYFRTDHHWAALGAYYACQQFADTAGLPFATLDQFVKTPVGTFVGSMYKYSGYSSVIEKNPDTLIEYKPKQSYVCDYYSRDRFKFEFTGSLFSNKVSYTRFIYGDSYIVHIHDTGVNNGRRLVVFKESYGNALTPFLISSFEEVYIIDMRYFELNAKDFIEDKKITDVCFSMCAFTVSSGSKREYITSILDN
ncbi:MAG: hypothetical protein IKT65_00850 [Clostridia bacterium]|nr:hypothetical protein [Clostridia bacterium]